MLNVAAQHLFMHDAGDGYVQHAQKLIMLLIQTDAFKPDCVCRLPCVAVCRHIGCC